MKKNHLLRAILGLTLSAFAVSASADEVSDFYDGKTINVIVPAGPASGYDIYARLMAEHFSNFMPGKPTVIVQNMPGGGGVKALRYYATVGKSDGTELLLSPQTIGTDAALGLLGGAVDVTDLNWIGRFTTNVPVGVVTKKAGIADAAEMVDKDISLGGTGARSPSIVFPKALNAFAGTNIKVVSGFPDPRQSFLAMMQGEIDGIVLGWSGAKSSNQEMLDSGEMIVLFQAAASRHPDLPDVPTVVDLAEGDANKAAMRFLASGSDIGRSIVAHPDVPEARVTALRDAFAAMLASSEFTETAATRNVELVNPADHAVLQGHIEETLAVEDAVLATVRKTLGL